MKKKSLLLLLPAAMLLASCTGEGSDVTPEEASKSVVSMKSKVTANDYEFPTKFTISSKVTKAGSMTDGSSTYSLDSTTESLIAVDNDSYYLHVKNNVDGESSDVYAYLDGESFYLVLNDKYTKYDAAMGKTIYEGLIASFGLDDAALKDTIVSFYDSSSDVIDTIIEYADGSVDLSSEGIASFFYSIKSKGEGHLFLSMNVGMAVGSTESTQSTSLEFDNYLPVSAKTDVRQADISYSGESSYQWGTCDLSKPDLSKLTEATAAA